MVSDRLTPARPRIILATFVAGLACMLGAPLVLIYSTSITAGPGVVCFVLFAAGVGATSRSVVGFARDDPASGQSARVRDQVASLATVILVVAFVIDAALWIDAMVFVHHDVLLHSAYDLLPGT